MSFNVNFNNNQPLIKESQKARDGGAGNTGYFQAGDEEEKKKKQSEESIFGGQKNKNDSFHREGEDEFVSKISFSEFIPKIIFFIKEFFKKNFNLKF